MGSKPHFKKKAIPLAIQQATLQQTFPDATCHVRRGKLKWCGKIQPTPLSKAYCVEVTYTLSQRPNVWVFGKELEKIEDSDFPHRYEKDVDKQRVRICLNLFHEFSARMHLAKTIVPWTVEWLYFYEIWLATGTWCGGGIHPRIRTSTPKSKRNYNKQE